MRTEIEILTDLEAICRQPGYIYTIAALCFRDNFVGYKDELKSDDYAKLFSWTRLIRSELSTVIGFLVKGNIDTTRPSFDDIYTRSKKTEELLAELHERMNFDFLPDFQAAIRGEIGDPFANAKGMREPIFYSGESAYTFQYRDLAPIKYRNDNQWMKSHLGFTVEEAIIIVRSIHDICLEKIHLFIEKVRWTRDLGHVCRLRTTAT